MDSVVFDVVVKNFCSCSFFVAAVVILVFDVFLLSYVGVDTFMLSCCIFGFTVSVTVVVIVAVVTDIDVVGTVVVSLVTAAVDIISYCSVILMLLKQLSLLLWMLGSFRINLNLSSSHRSTNWTTVKCFCGHFHHANGGHKLEYITRIT